MLPRLELPGLNETAAYALLTTFGAELLWALWLMGNVSRENRLYYYGARLLVVGIGFSFVRAFYLGLGLRVYRFWLLWQFFTFPIPSYSIQRYFHLSLGCLLLFAQPAEGTELFNGLATNAQAGMGFSLVALIYTLVEDFSRFDRQRQFGGSGATAVGKTRKQ
jgi:hypothetical protein